LQLKTDAGRFESPAADEVLERIVPKEPEVPRPAARTDTRLDGNASPTNALLGQRVEIRGAGGLQFGKPPRLLRQATEPIGDEHHDLRIVFHMQLASQLMHIHRKKQFLD